MDPHHRGGRFSVIRDRIKSEVLDDPRPGVGASTLAIGLTSGLIWFFLIYVLPGWSSWGAKFLVVAVCFVLWGMADVSPRSWRVVAAVLRAAVFVFLLGFGAWLLFGLLAAF